MNEEKKTFQEFLVHAMINFINRSLIALNKEQQQNTVIHFHINHQIIKTDFSVNSSSAVTYEVLISSTPNKSTSEIMYLTHFTL